ncbi:MAG: hypothetical protein K0R92_2321 [Lachnospiraceae bacterium]|jgi:negative regulator of flagellin synthesis FlgM|nr:hypothetical protein [Lachnospiraceae bacterium]
MRIDAYNKVTQLYQSNNAKKTAKTNGTGASDQVEISRIGKDYQVAKQAVTGAADVRMDKVNEIKARMESGTYNVSMEEVADKILSSYYDKLI